MFFSADDFVEGKRLLDPVTGRVDDDLSSFEELE